MQVVLCEPRKIAIVTKIENKLETMQNIVGGLIQVIYPFDDNVALVYNDEGKINNLPYNRRLLDRKGNLLDIIAGTFFICSFDEEGNFTSLTDEQAEKYKNIFNLIY